MTSGEVQDERARPGGVMPATILFDLDGTLFDNPLEAFAPAFLQLFVEHFGRYAPAQKALSATLSAVEAMDGNAGTPRSNKEVFADVFCPAAGIEPESFDRHVEEFVAREFPKLVTLTRRLPEARPLVAWAMQNASQVVIATGMQLPLAAAEHRLAWAGVPVTDFTYTFITTWDNMHASKPHPAFYEELIAQLGRQPAECLMVGDDWEHDILPATSIGIPSYWVAAPGEASPAACTLLAGQGTLADLVAWLSQMAG